MTAPISRAMGPSQWLMLIVLSIVWGGSFFFFAVAIRELPTFTADEKMSWNRLAGRSSVSPVSR